IDWPAGGVAQKLGIMVIELSLVLEAEAGIFTLRSDTLSQSFCDGFAEAQEVALLLQTSGTTASRSKLVPLTHANIYAATKKVQAVLEISCHDRYLNIAHLFHSHGVMLTLSSLFTGACVVCPPGFSPDHFFKWIEQFHPTWYSAAPAIQKVILTQSRTNLAVIDRV